MDDHHLLGGQPASFFKRDVTQSRAFSTSDMPVAFDNRSVHLNGSGLTVDIHARSAVSKKKSELPVFSVWRESVMVINSLVDDGELCTHTQPTGEGGGGNRDTDGVYTSHTHCVTG